MHQSTQNVTEQADMGTAQRMSLYTILGTILATLVLITLLVCWYRAGWEEMRRMDCACNLKQINLLLYMYAEKYDGWFPDKDGQAGLETLRKDLWDEAYLKNVPCLFNCPSVQPAVKNAISYDYIGGYRIDSEKDTPIIMDRIGNHKHFGNIGFVDGHIQPFTGQEWQTRAADAKVRNSK